MGRAVVATLKSGALVNEGRACGRVSYGLFLFFDTTKEIIIGQNNVVAEPRRKKHTETALLQRLPPFLLVSSRRGGERLEFEQHFN